MDAPLSSPTMGSSSQNQQRSYFSSASTSSSTTSMNTQASGPTSAPQSQAQAHQVQIAPVQRPTDTTTTFRRDFNLVAEAAKRAQIACLMRDFESVGLSG